MLQTKLRYVINKEIKYNLMYEPTKKQFTCH